MVPSLYYILTSLNRRDLILVVHGGSAPVFFLRTARGLLVNNKDSKRVSTGDISRRSKFRVTRDTVANKVGDQVVLVQVETDRIFSLNPTAARLWELLCASLNRAEIQAKLMDEFDVSETILASEIDGILNKFLQEQLIDVDNGSSGN